MQTDKPLWTPDPERIQGSQIAAFARKAGIKEDDFGALWRWSVEEPEAFWAALWDFCGIEGERGGIVLQEAGRMESARFFPEARLNYAENCLTRRDDAPGMIFRGETGPDRILSFAEIYGLASRWALALRAAGVVKGDRVAGFMPNLPETIIAMLATASIGAIWSSASPDFGVQGLLDRFGQIAPKILIAVDGYPYGGKAIDCMGKIREIVPRLEGLQKTIIVPFLDPEPKLTGLPPGTATMKDFLAPFAAAEIAFERIAFDHPLWIMFSSGTTGVPKCIVHGHGGPLLQLVKEHRLHCDIRSDDRVFYFTTCGWMMWNWLATSLASGACLLLYDGSPFYPDGNVLWDFTAQYGCTLFGTGAKYIDALKSGGLRPVDTHDLSAMRTITSTGSPLVHESFDYVYDAIKRDVHLASISGGTDIVSCFVLGNPVSPVWRGEIQGPGLGLAMDVYDDAGQPVPPGAGTGAKAGELVCTRPFPSMPVSFWNDDTGAKYHDAYFARFDNMWCHGDWVERTAHKGFMGGFIIHGRSDATLNPGGVRIGTAEIYRQVEQVPEVLESIAVGQDWQGDVRVILFVRLKDSVTLDETLIKRIKTRIRDGASPRHVPAKILQVTDIPRTKSGKITEIAVRDIIHGRLVKNSEALANPGALEAYKNLPDLQD